MNAHDLEVLNRRNRMTPEERDADIVREAMGPFAALFGIAPAPIYTGPAPANPTEPEPLVVPVSQTEEE